MNKLRVIAMIQARMGSTRLPRKVLAPIAGKSTIGRIVERLLTCKELDDIVISTTTKIEDDPVVEFAMSHGIQFYRGSEMDLVDRMFGTIRKFEGDGLVRITGDCPLVDPDLVDLHVSTFRDSGGSLEYISNIFPRTFPHGLDIEILSLSALRRLNQEIQDQEYRELFNHYIRANSVKFKIENIAQDRDLSHLRWTLDYREDLEFLEQVFGYLDNKSMVCKMDDVLALLTQHPYLETINEKWVTLEHDPFNSMKVQPAGKQGQSDI